MNKKSTIVISSIIIIAILAVISFLIVKNVGNNGQSVNQNQNVNQVTNGEVDTSDWLIYRNEEYGFEFKYPNEWSPVIEVLKDFYPAFDQNKIDGVFSLGFFDNKKSLKVEEWVDNNDFFKLNQYNDPDVYVAHGVEDPIKITTNEKLEITTYFGRASGGGSFGTALIPVKDKLLVLAYSLSPSEEEHNKRVILINIIRSFRNI